MQVNFYSQLVLRMNSTESAAGWQLWQKETVMEGKRATLPQLSFYANSWFCKSGEKYMLQGCTGIKEVETERMWIFFNSLNLWEALCSFIYD